MKLQSVELRVPDVEGTARFFEQVWGLSRAGNGAAVRLRGTAGLPYIIELERGAPALRSISFCRTRHMSFVRCNRVHHCIAYARGGFASLNHIAFEMADIDGVMRGIGRMRDAGFPPVWGPGRHGPGNNVFGYFVGPHGGVIEYTA